MLPSSASSTPSKSPPGTDPVQLARVIGNVVVTRKDENLSDRTLLVLQPIGADGTAVGRTLVAVDAVGAGVGETVFFVRGKEAGFPFHPVEVPADAGVVGIVDHYDVIEEFTTR
jgi:ethanolamine utilization protein EutN